MKRRRWHAAFAALAMACAVVAIAQGLRLRQRMALNEAVAAVSAAPAAALSTRDTAGATGAASEASAAGSNAIATDEPAAVQLARATALARAGADDAAFKLYSALIAAGPQDAIAREALFNLGNLYLRQALRLQPQLPASGAAAAKAPAEAELLVELAKQRYRDLLRATPDDWDARYNLERALRLAPEEQAAQAEADPTPVERRQVMLRGMAAEDLP